jgi:hypothetical protein
MGKWRGGRSHSLRAIAFVVCAGLQPIVVWLIGPPISRIIKRLGRISVVWLYVLVVVGHFFAGLVAGATVGRSLGSHPITYGLLASIAAYAVSLAFGRYRVHFATVGYTDTGRSFPMATPKTKIVGGYLRSLRDHLTPVMVGACVGIWGANHYHVGW